MLNRLSTTSTGAEKALAKAKPQADAVVEAGLPMAQDDLSLEGPRPQARKRMKPPMPPEGEGAPSLGKAPTLGRHPKGLTKPGPEGDRPALPPRGPHGPCGPEAQQGQRFRRGPMPAEAGPTPGGGAHWSPLGPRQGGQEGAPEGFAPPQGFPGRRPMGPPPGFEGAPEGFGPPQGFEGRRPMGPPPGFPGAFPGGPEGFEGELPEGFAPPQGFEGPEGFAPTRPFPGQGRPLMPQGFPMGPEGFQPPMGPPPGWEAGAEGLEEGFEGEFPEGFAPPQAFGPGRPMMPPPQGFPQPMGEAEGWDEEALEGAEGLEAGPEAWSGDPSAFLQEGQAP